MLHVEDTTRVTLITVSGRRPRGASLNVLKFLRWFQVKADRNNKKLYTLQQASRHVRDMAAVVVTSTKHGQRQISDQGERKW